MSTTYSYVQFTSILLIIIIIQGLGDGIGISGATTITIINRCKHKVWPGILANAGSDKLENTTGFLLQPGGSARSFQAPPGWSGRFWGRTGCNFDDSDTAGSCVTGDCGSNQIECNGAGARPPATLAEFFIGGGGGKDDFYDVSLVDGYNLPVMVEPSSSSCAPTGCVTDINRMCPEELRVGNGDVEACKSACGAFGSPEYCCSGEYGSPSACKPSVYSQTFKSACPKAYTYAYDDRTSTFTCSSSPDYTITFCPSITSQKSLTMTGPPVATAGNSKSGSEDDDDDDDDDSNPYGWPWLPNFVTGDSSTTIYKTNILCYSTLMIIVYSLIILLLLQY